MGENGGKVKGNIFPDRSTLVPDSRIRTEVKFELGHLRKIWILLRKNIQTWSLMITQAIVSTMKAPEQQVLQHPRPCSYILFIIVYCLLFIVFLIVIIEDDLWPLSADISPCPHGFQDHQERFANPLFKGIFNIHSKKQTLEMEFVHVWENRAPGKLKHPIALKNWPKRKFSRKRTYI